MIKVTFFTRKWDENSLEIAHAVTHNVTKAVRTVKIGSMYASCRKVTYNQNDQIGLFLKGLGYKIYIKLAEMFGDCLAAILKRVTCYVKNATTTF